MWGEGAATSSPPTSRFRNNSCKDDSALFSRFLYGKTERQRKDRQTDKRNDRTTKREKDKGKDRQIEETETDRQKYRQIERQKDRQIKRQTEGLMLSDKKISITDHTHKAPLALHTLSLIYLQAQGFLFKGELCFTNRILLIRSHRLRVFICKRGVLFQRQKSTNNSSFGSPEKYVTSDELEKQKLKRKKAAFKICGVLC